LLLKVSLGKKLTRTHLKKQAGHGVPGYNLSCVEGMSRRINGLRLILGKNSRPYLKNNLKQKGLWGVTQEIECLHNKHRALSLNSCK
jgi:hypothetical protein